jgi:hypothetical protein
LPTRVGLVLTLLAAVTLSHGAPARAQAQNDHLIVPWKRIGPVALDMSVAEMIDVMVEPASKWPGVVDVYNWHDVSATVTKDGFVGHA